VDLPGVRDANTARARVAQTYLQCCHKIWIVAPISKHGVAYFLLYSIRSRCTLTHFVNCFFLERAVDDGIAKELLGEQFQRRMLMDGNYGMLLFAIAILL
jgi:hypothetical protein